MVSAPVSFSTSVLVKSCLVSASNGNYPPLTFSLNASFVRIKNISAVHRPKLFDNGAIEHDDNAWQTTMALLNTARPSLAGF